MWQARRHLMITPYELDYIAAGIQALPCHSSPFQHMQFERFLPEFIFQDMVRHLPEIGACHELRHKDAIGADNKSTRLQFKFTVHEWRSMPQESRHFWVDALAIICHPKITEAVGNALHEGMERRFGEKWSTVRLKPEPSLIRDQTGYRIGIHPDHLGKVITLQIYLPADDSQVERGTIFYRQIHPLKHPVEPGKPVHAEDQDKFEVAKRMDFLPNTGYAFVVQPDSWHGVDTVQPGGKSRDSLMIHYHLA